MMAAQERDKDPTQPVTTGKSSDRGFLRLPAFGFFKRFLKVPAAAWARIAALIAILACIKIALIFRLAPHLFQIHWRVAGNETTWMGRAAFILFILLATLHLFFLARDCRLAGTKTVRIATAALLLLGLIFICLTFHNGDKNYLYPILTGILKWSSLGPYLSLDFFFRSPFLAAWIFLLALTYYALVRTNREAWAVYITAMFGALYGCLHLHQLAEYQDELLAVDGFGLVSLIFLFRKKRGLPAAAMLAPMAWTACFAVIVIHQ